MNTPHKWAKEIKAWADGVTIQSAYQIGPYPLWKDESNPQWNDEKMLFRVKTRHQAVKDAYAAGAEIEIFVGNGDWLTCTCPEWIEEDDFRGKERAFPVTSLSNDELIATWNRPGACLRTFANAAIKQYILDQEKGK